MTLAQSGVKVFPLCLVIHPLKRISVVSQTRINKSKLDTEVKATLSLFLLEQIQEVWVESVFDLKNPSADVTAYLDLFKSKRFVLK